MFRLAVQPLPSVLCGVGAGKAQVICGAQRPLEPHPRPPDVLQVVEKCVMVPQTQVIEVPVEKIVERIVEVPVDRVVERFVDVPVEKVVEKFVEIEKIIEQFVEVPMEKFVEVLAVLDCPPQCFLDLDH